VDKPEGLQTGFTVNMMMSNYAAVAGLRLIPRALKQQLH